MENENLTPELPTVENAAPMAPAPTESAPLPKAAPKAPQVVNVIDPDTQEIGSIPHHQLADAISQGYQPATNEQVESYLDQQKYGTAGQQALTAGEGAVSAATFGLVPGIDRKESLKRREINPMAHMLGQGAGIVGSSMLLPGGGAAGVMTKAGEAAADVVGLAGLETTGALGRIGSSAVKASAENALFQAGDEVSKFIAGDPHQHLDTAAINIGMSGLMGAPFGAGLGSIAPLWRAAAASEVGQVLKAISDRAGGIEGVIPDSLHSAIETSGLTIAPEIRAGLSDNPQLQQMFKTLEQSDTTKSGLELQKTYQNFRKDVSENLLHTFGKTEADLASIEGLSKYESGKVLGKTLSEEFSAQVDPLAEGFQKLGEKYKEIELPQDHFSEDSYTRSNVRSVGDLGTASYRGLDPITGEPMIARQHLRGEALPIEVTGPSLGDSPRMIPGTASILSDQIGQLAAREGWTTILESDIMSKVNKIISSLPKQKKLSDLTKLISQVGSEMTDFTNPSMTRAGSLIKNLLRDEESKIIVGLLGKEGPEKVAEHAALRSAWKAASELKDSLDSRLHVGGGSSIQSFIKNLKEMSESDAEKVLHRLSGKNSAETLQVLQDKFPRTAEALREFHINDFLKSAAAKAAPGEPVSVQHFLNQINKASPELKSFLMTPQVVQKIEALATIVDQFKKVPHNFSNTARTMDKLSQYLPGSAMGLVSMLTGHNPATALLVGSLLKPIGKDMPDAIRLGLLKFLGSSKPISSGAFKSMVEVFDHAIKGETLLTKAVKGTLKAGQVVLPQGFIPTEKDRAKLEKVLKSYQENPNKMFEVGGDAGHYLPQHGAALGEKATTSIQYLNSLRPSTAKANPLDGEVKPSKMAKAAYNNALNIAEQPLVVLEHLAKGALTPEDVIHLNNLYPALHQRMVQKLTDQMIETTSKGESIPYKVRLGMSVLMGQPLDSTMTPQAIQSTQPKPQAMAQGQPQERAKHSMTALNKMPAMDMTPQQSREAQRLKG